MKAALRIGWLLLRQGRRLDLIGPLLAVIAVTVSVTILLLTLGVNVGLEGRALRSSWRTPAEVGRPQATALEAVSTDFVTGLPLIVVDLAALKASSAVPPGLSRFPTPGEVWVSPALARLLNDLPPEQLANRYLAPGEAPAGTIGPDALAYDSELVAVIGRNPDDQAMTTPRRPDPRRTGDVTTATPINAYQQRIIDFSPQALYVGLGRLAAVLVAVPLLVLGGAAARLSVSRRDQRLATLRLIGASPQQIVTITVVEAVLTALAGTVLGTGLYAALLPLASHISVGGSPFSTGNLWVGASILLLVAVAIPLLVAGSAVVGMRGLVVSPLGVTRRQTPAPLKALRLLVFGAVLLGYAKVSTGADAALMSVLVALAAAFLALALIGPWVLAVLGRLVAQRASTLTMLLVGRRLSDDPRSAWRTVGGVTLAAFIAGFLAPYSSGDSHSLGEGSELVIAAPAQRAPTLANEAQRDLKALNISADVTTRFDPVLGTKPERLVVVVAVDDPRELERARTALHALSPGQPPVSEDDINWRDRQFAADYRTVGLLVLVAVFGIATASATITTAASTIDQRRTIRLLHLAGTPMSILYRAHTAQVLVPLLITGGGGLLVGLICAAPYTWLSGAPIDLAGIAVLLICAAAGAGCTVLATTLSRPLVRAMRAAPE